MESYPPESMTMDTSSLCYPSDMLHRRDVLLGRARSGVQPPPPWRVADASIKYELMRDQRAYTQNKNGGALRDLESKLFRLQSYWIGRRLREMRTEMEHTADDLLALDTREPIMYFFALGGLDLFIRILCEPPPFTHAGVDSLAPVQPVTDQEKSAYVLVLGEITKVLTDVIICSPELSWYIYDRYPGAFYRLLDLMLAPDLSLPACTMLEQMLSNVGPVMEIARNPCVARLLQSKHDGVAICGCRIVALLVMPGLALGMSPFSYRRLLPRQMVLPFKRVQRVIDSNVLWLLSEPSLVERLIRLCEVRPTGGVRVQGGNRTVTVMGPAETRRMAAEIDSVAASLGLERPGDPTTVFGLTTPVAPETAAGPAETSSSATDTASEASAPGLLRHVITAIDGLVHSVRGRAAGGGSSGPQLPVDVPATQDEVQQLLEQRAALPNAVALGTVEDGRAGPAQRQDSGQPDDHSAQLGEPSAPPAGRPLELSGSGEWEDADWEDVADEPAPPPLLPASLSSSPRLPPVVTAVGEDLTRDPPSSSSEVEEDGEFYDEEDEDDYNDGMYDGDGGRGDRDDDWSDEDVNDAVDEALLQGADEEETRVELDWFIGSTDTRQRWRLRDPTLTRVKSDTRAQLYMCATTAEDVATFYRRDAAGLQAVGADVNTATPFGLRLLETQHMVVNSQSEVLYLLNVMLSTFYFGDPWQRMQDCHWMERANTIFNAAFGLDNDVSRLVDLPAQPHLSARQLALPRFRSFAHKADGESCFSVPIPPAPSPPATEAAATASSDVSPSASPTTAATAASPPPSSGGVYRMPSLWAIYGRSKAAFATDRCTPNLQQEDEFFDPKENMQGPDTVRKLELLRGIHEFWNAQDRYECAKLQTEEIVKASADIARKVVQMLVSGKEDHHVEITAFTMLELYLRGFSSPRGLERCRPNSPQSEIGKLLLSNILRKRIYNGARVPGLPSSLAPRRRVEAVAGACGELLWYHYNNLRQLCQLVRGTTDLTALNDASSPTTGAAEGITDTASAAANGREAVGGGSAGHVPSHLIRSHAQEEVLRVLSAPPLDREEHEPFASVLLRRMYGYGLETHLILRALALSLTPGLRSTHNYAGKAAGRPLEPIDVAFTSRTRSQDLVTGNQQRIPYVRCLSRRFAARITDIMASLSEEEEGDQQQQQQQQQPQMQEEAAERKQTKPEPDGLGTPAGACRTMLADTLVELLEKLANAPHRLPLRERAFPALYGDDDKALLRGELEPPPPGTADAWALPLFGHTVPDTTALRYLAPLSEVILAEPHKLLFSLLRPLQVELMEDINFLGVITSSVIVLLREARLHGFDGGIKGVLDRMKPLAEREYAAWVVEVERSAAARARERQLNVGCTSAIPRRAAPATVDDEVAYRCPSYALFGECCPSNDARVYFTHYGGCVYRHYFRLLCLWLAHYATCQRYVETIFYCTEVAFAEFKLVALYLLRTLPWYFQKARPFLREEEE